jgi:hypothetical protein
LKTKKALPDFWKGLFALWRGTNKREEKRRKEIFFAYLETRRWRFLLVSYVLVNNETAVNKKGSKKILKKFSLQEKIYISCNSS